MVNLSSQVMKGNEIQGADALQEHLFKAMSSIRNTRALFEQLASDFYKDEKRIFTLKGPGKYKDLSERGWYYPRKQGDTSIDPRIVYPERWRFKGQKTRWFRRGYAEWKPYFYGEKYPLLFATGRLAASLLSRSAPGAICNITSDAMIVGSAVPYAKYHQSERPRTKMPRRPLWFVDDNAPLLNRWIRTCEVYYQKALAGDLV